MNWIADRLTLDPAQASRQIEDFLRRKLRDLGRSGIIVGLSGGLDSAITAYLSVGAVGKERVTLLNLPDRDSRAIHRRHAELIARELGVRLHVREITTILETMGVYDVLPIGHLPGQRMRESVARLGKSFIGIGRAEHVLEERLHPDANSWVAKGNAYAMSKHRVRMVLIYLYAEISNLMVVGAANRTELLTGTFSKWGCDQCADVMPIIHLYRSQLPPLAEYLQLPEAIRSKPADPDIIPGVDNKEKLLGSFVQTDQILWGLENGVGHDELAQLYGSESVTRIETLRELSRHMRESPYVIDVSAT